MVICCGFCVDLGELTSSFACAQEWDHTSIKQKINGHLVWKKVFFFFLVFAMFSKHMLYNVQYLAYFEYLWESAKCLQKFFLQGPIFKGLQCFKCLQLFYSITRVWTLKRPNWCEGDICILSLHFNLITIMSWFGKLNECTT